MSRTYRNIRNLGSGGFRNMAFIGDCRNALAIDEPNLSKANRINSCNKLCARDSYRDIHVSALFEMDWLSKKAWQIVDSDNAYGYYERKAAYEAEVNKALNKLATVSNKRALARAQKSAICESAFSEC